MKPWSLRCPTCGHVYRSRRELRRLFREQMHSMVRWEWRQLRSPQVVVHAPLDVFLAVTAPTRRDLLVIWVAAWLVRADRILFCGLCSHDL